MISEETMVALKEIKMNILKIHPDNTSEQAMQAVCISVIDEYIENNKED